jgi:hypothetical protein
MQKDEIRKNIKQKQTKNKHEKKPTKTTTTKQKQCTLNNSVALNDHQRLTDNKLSTIISHYTLNCQSKI